MAELESLANKARNATGGKKNYLTFCSTTMHQGFRKFMNYTNTELGTIHKGESKKVELKEGEYFSIAIKANEEYYLAISFSTGRNKVECPVCGEETKKDFCMCKPNGFILKNDEYELKQVNNKIIISDEYEFDTRIKINDLRIKFKFNNDGLIIMPESNDVYYYKGSPYSEFKKTLKYYHLKAKDLEGEIIYDKDGDWAQFSPENSGKRSFARHAFSWKLHIYAGFKHTPYNKITGNITHLTPYYYADVSNIHRIIIPLLYKLRYKGKIVMFKIQSDEYGLCLWDNEKPFTIYFGKNEFTQKECEEHIKFLAEEIDKELVKTGQSIPRKEWASDNKQVPGTSSGRIQYRRSHDERAKSGTKSYLHADKGLRFYKTILDPFNKTKPEPESAYTAYTAVENKSYVGGYKEKSNKLEKGEEEIIGLKTKMTIIMPYNKKKNMILSIYFQEENELGVDERFHFNKKINIVYIGKGGYSVFVKQFYKNGEEYPYKKEFYKRTDCNHLSTLNPEITEYEYKKESEGQGSIRLEALPDNNIKITNTGVNPIYYHL